MKTERTAERNTEGNKNAEMHKEIQIEMQKEVQKERNSIIQERKKLGRNAERKMKKKERNKA